MNKTEDTFESWNEVILDFFENRISTTKLFKAREFIEKKDKDISMEKDPKKKKRMIIARKKKVEELQKLRKYAPSTEIREWIEKNSKTKVKDERERIVKATHALRFSHSSASAQGLIVQQKDEDKNSLILSTSSFRKKLVYDMAHNNGALVSISRFLSLKIGNEQVYDLLVKDDYSFLESFAKDSDQKDRWGNGFSSLIKTDVIKTGDKTKQVYFPIKFPPKTDSDYHLLIPLFASSLCEEIYSTVNNSKFSDEQKEISESIKKQQEGKPVKYLPETSTILTNQAVLKFGGAQPQNVSMLNKGRTWKASKNDRTTYGITYLFSSQPPVWQSEIKPPINRQSLFNELYSSTIRVEVDYLRDFLVRFKQLDLSIRDPKRKRHLERWVNNIVDEFLFYTATIQNLPAGWSDTENIKLKEAHRYLLDPYRNDEAFQSARKNIDWQKTIRDDFAIWLNRLLRGKDKQFTPQREHSKLWRKLLEQPLREHMQRIDQEVKQRVEDAV